MTEALDNDRRGAILLRLAREALEDSFGMGSRPSCEIEPWLEEPGATFVTLTLDGKLRGCIGSLTADRPLLEDLVHNARAAAFDDPRFPELRLDELERVEIEVSLLSPVAPIDCEDEGDLLSQLRPGLDGVVLECGFRRGTFLPQVWEQLPDPKTFLAHLKKKAGLSGEPWSPEWKVGRYTVAKWREGVEA